MALPLKVCRLGLIDYDRAFALQQRLVERLARQAEPAEGYLLLLEHPPTFTLGRSGSERHVLASPAELEAAGARLIPVNRGGDVTFHGPGQLVAYPIIPLRGRGRDIHAYLRRLEEAIIRTLARFGVEGRRDPINTGVWVGRNKLAAIGVAIRRWITYHGAAINVATDLRYFDMIVPCGVRGRGVTSLSRVLGREVSLEEVADRFVEEFAVVFDAAPAACDSLPTEE